MSQQKNQTSNSKNSELLMFGLQRSSRRNKTIHPFNVNSVTENSQMKQPLNIQQEVTYLKKKILWYEQKLDKIIIQFQRQAQKLVQIQNIIFKNEKQWYHGMNGVYNLSEYKLTPVKEFYPQKEIQIKLKKDQIQLIKNSTLANNKQIQQIYIKLQQFEAFNLMNRLCDIQNTIEFQVKIIKMIEEKVTNNSKNIQILTYKMGNSSKSTEKKLKKDKQNPMLI